MLNKEECIKHFEIIKEKIANNDVLMLYDLLDELVCFKILIEEHFDPQPYKFEDLKVGMWVYDTKSDIEEFTFFKITKILSEKDCDYLYHNKTNKVLFNNMTCHALKFEENRFYPVTKAMQEI